MNNLAEQKAVVRYHGQDVEIPSRQSRLQRVKTNTGFTITAYTDDQTQLKVNGRDSIMLPAYTKRAISVDITNGNKGKHKFHLLDWHRC